MKGESRKIGHHFSKNMGRARFQQPLVLLSGKNQRGGKAKGCAGKSPNFEKERRQSRIQHLVSKKKPREES